MNEVLLNCNFTSVIVQIIVALRRKKGLGEGSKGEKKKVEGSLWPQCLPAPTPATQVKNLETAREIFL